MPLTKAQKKEIIDIFKAVDVKRLDVEVDDATKQKWFRFGSYNGMQIASEIIKALPEARNVKARAKVS